MFVFSLCLFLLVLIREGLKQAPILGHMFDPCLHHSVQRTHCTGPQRNWSFFYLATNSVILVMIHSLNLKISCKMMGLTFYIQQSMTSRWISFVVLNIRCANSHSLSRTLFG